MCWSAQVLSFLVGLWTHQSQLQLCLGNSFLKPQVYINKDNASPPSGVPVGMHWWKNWVFPSSSLGARGLTHQSEPWHHVLGCPGAPRPGKNRQKPVTQVGEEEPCSKIQTTWWTGCTRGQPHGSLPTQARCCQLPGSPTGHEPCGVQLKSPF